MESLRRYGVCLLVAVVLLPPQLAALAAAVIAVVYIFMRYTRQRGDGMGGKGGAPIG